MSADNVENVLSEIEGGAIDTSTFGEMARANAEAARTNAETARNQGTFMTLLKGALDMLTGKKGEDEKPKGDPKADDDDAPDGKQMEMDGLGDPDDEGDDDPDDEGMEKGMCPHCRHLAPASDFGILSKGAGYGMAIDEDSLGAMIERAVATAVSVALEESDLRKGFALVAEVNQNLAEAQIMLSEKVDEMAKGQEAMIKGFTTRPTFTPAVSPMDLAAQNIAGQRTAERFSVGEEMNKGEGAKVRLTENELHRALALGHMNTDALTKYRTGEMSVERIQEIRRQVSQSPAA